MDLEARPSVEWQSPEGATVTAFYGPTGGAPVRLVVDNPSGVTTADLRSLGMSKIRAAIAERVLPQEGEPVGRVTGERALAAFAARYAALVEAGVRQPVEHLRHETGESRNTVSARIRRAREAGLLTRPQGDDLGRLTPHGRRLASRE